ncbi:hypothetical protein L1049_020109 [Liquidambar formosana]|uniref:Uncharacterized protein n=1 Tax=Liquidambar formosana TaxID=63359 RepID=A0AAP0XAJ0_LIQFO
MVLKEQIRVIKLGEGEVRFLEKVVLFGSNTQRMEEWENGSLVPQDTLRAAQIQGISRRYELHWYSHSNKYKKHDFYFLFIHFFMHVGLCLKFMLLLAYLF